MASFEHFLALRGDDVETARWEALRGAENAFFGAMCLYNTTGFPRQARDRHIIGKKGVRKRVFSAGSDRLQILSDVPLPCELLPIVVEKCRGAVALGLSLGGALTLIDDILTVRRLRYHPDPGISLLLTPEGKLRASYLGLGVKGRPTTLRCVGVCGLVRHSGDFSYNARRAASQIQLVWATDDDAERNAHAGRTEQDSTPSTIAVVAAEHAAEQAAAAPFEREAQGRVICYGCAAAEDAVSLLVQNVFRLPSVWADLVRKARTRWSIEARCEGVFFAPHLC